MSVTFQSVADTFRQALLRVGVTQERVALLAGVDFGQMSKLINGKASDTPANTGRMRRIARTVMALALRAGLTEDAAWELNEQALFGLHGELDRETVMSEVREMKTKLLGVPAGQAEVKS